MLAIESALQLRVLLGGVLTPELGFPCCLKAPAHLVVTFSGNTALIPLSPPSLSRLVPSRGTAVPSLGPQHLWLEVPAVLLVSNFSPLLLSVIQEQWLC